MRFPFKAVVALTVVVVCGMFPVVAAGDHPSRVGHAAVAPKFAAGKLGGCAHTVTPGRFDRTARRAYHGTRHIPRSARPDLLRMRHCSPARSRNAETRLWIRLVHAHNRRVRHQRFIARYEPYSGCTDYGGCSHWAIPACMVNGESGGRLTSSAPDGSGGLYGILVSSWDQFGGTRWAAVAPAASKRAQSIVATRILHAVGFGGWQTAAPCGY